MRYDTTLKDLFHGLPQTLFKLLVGQEARERLPCEFASVKKRVPDLVVRLLDETILHLELQSDGDKSMVWRMVEYFGMIRQEYPEATLRGCLVLP
ncbi:MAG: hypothetical protein HQL97_16915 [Magnetococcales bacterium]|nr:hypothetical protein [Magnetococcales bacterium]